MEGTTGERPPEQLDTAHRAPAAPRCSAKARAAASAAAAAAVASAIVLAVVLSVADAAACTPYPNAALPAWLPTGSGALAGKLSWSACRAASGLGQPRGVLAGPETAGDVLFTSRTGEGVRALYNCTAPDGDGCKVATLTAQSDVNHGIAVWGGFLFAASTTTVYRWPYAAGSRTDLGAPTVVVQGIPSGGHWSRSLAVDGAGRLYVQVGSAGNVDADSRRSRINRFPSGATYADPSAAGMPAGGYAFEGPDSTLFADGVRNEAGLAFDSSGGDMGAVLWGVENGADSLTSSALGGDIHNDNPGEELNRFAVAGRSYGYPDCWSEYKLPAGVGGGRGTQWAWPGRSVNDAWCRNKNNNEPPHVSMQAHSAPLGMSFLGAPYRAASGAVGSPQAGCTPTAVFGAAASASQGVDCAACRAMRVAGLLREQQRGDAVQVSVGMPCCMLGDLFVAFHGSWNRSPKTGYKVVRVPFDATTRLPAHAVSNTSSAAVQDILWHAGATADWPTALRPVDLAFDGEGRMYVTSDASGEIVLVQGHLTSCDRNREMDAS